MHQESLGTTGPYNNLLHKHSNNKKHIPSDAWQKCPLLFVVDLATARCLVKALTTQCNLRGGAMRSHFQLFRLARALRPLRCWKIESSTFGRVLPRHCKLVL